jgi:murein L,D-transpeptidase YcbB/YkuD
VFWFPNKYDVYLHDTPMKPLFKRDVRPFSHGCMRLQDPFRLGELVWEQQWPKDTVTADTLRNWALKAESEVRYGLKKYIPIEVDYITSTADSLGNIFFHYDVYGRDEKYFAIIRKAFAFGEK